MLTLFVGHFLSLNEIQNLVSPSKKDHDIVFNYFAQKGNV